MKIKLFKITVFIIFLFSSIFINAQWEKWNNGFDKYAYTIHSIASSGNNIFAGTNHGIYVSTDNGKNWNLSGFNNNEIHTIISSGNNVFTGLTNGFYLTSDNGKTWISKKIGLPQNPFISAMFIEENNIFIGTEWADIYYSSNLGDSWTMIQKSLTNTSISSILVKNKLIYVGTSNGLFITSDNGYSWSKNNSGLRDTNIVCLANLDNNIYAGTRSGMLIYDEDKKIWKDAFFNFNTISCVFKFEKYIFIGGSYGIFLSTDNGDSWPIYNNWFRSDFIESMVSNGKYIFAGTTSNGIFRAKLSDFGISNVEENISTEPHYLIIYPNPANYFITVSNPNNQKIEIYSTIGLKVLETDNQEKIDVSGLAAGVYYVKVGDKVCRFVKI